MQIWAIANGANHGAVVKTFTLKNGEISIPAIIIGEDGRGRQRGVLPVHLLPENHAKWNQEGQVLIKAATIGTTKAGRPKLFEAETASAESDKFIAVMRTEIGFRGSNIHSGDIFEHKVDSYGDDCSIFEKWPGENICSGYIAQGCAGRAGGGDQYVSIMPKGVVFRTRLGGRMYGKPREYYYKHNGKTVLFCTHEEREVSDLL